MTQHTQSQCSMTTWRGRVGWEMGAAVRMEGTPVYLWLTHVDVWQKPSQYCKVIILQLKQIIKRDPVLLSPHSFSSAETPAASRLGAKALEALGAEGASPCWISQINKLPRITSPVTQVTHTKSHCTGLRN